MNPNRLINIVLGIAIVVIIVLLAYASVGRAA